MHNRDSIRDKRRASANALRLLALSGIAISLSATAGTILLGQLAA